MRRLLTVVSAGGYVLPIALVVLLAAAYLLGERDGRSREYIRVVNAVAEAMNADPSEVEVWVGLTDGQGNKR
jgi:hypothetical protein